MDYKALNNLYINDRFLIPTVDELLDELHELLDHHIPMHEANIHKTTF